MNAQEEIRSAIKSCKAPVLNQNLLWTPRHYSTLTSFEDLSSTTRSTTQFYDVPLTSIVMLGRDGPDRVYEEIFGRRPDGGLRVLPLTWRLLMNHWLRDDRWGQAALDMIASPFGRRPFPVPGSHDYLSLISYGGALSCYVGNHRIVAAVCWAAAHGMSHLKEVEVSVRPVPSSAISELISKFDEGWKIEVCHAERITKSSNARSLLIETERSPLIILSRSNNGGRLLRETYWLIRNSLERTFERDLYWWEKLILRERPPKKTMSERVSEVPRSVIEAWRNSGWLNNPLPNPEN